MKRSFLLLTFAAGAAIMLLAGSARPAPATELAPVQLTPERRQLIGVTFATVERREVSRRIEAVGNVVPDEQLESYVQTRFAGWIERVFVNQSFQRVRRGQPLFTVYSPDLAATEQEYVLALRARERVADSSIEGVSEGADSLAQAAAERLSLMGVPRAEVARLARGGPPRNVVTVVSPASGYVVERNAVANLYVQPETRLYTITDFSTIWVYAAVFQDDIGAIRPGDRADFIVDAYPGERFVGRVDYVWPQIDTATRTARVRVVLGNRDGRLKPGMYGRVALHVALGEQIVAPASGVLRTGTHNVVFIDRGHGSLLPAYVELGPRVGDDLVVLQGLAAGQRIVASANFLVDSESQLQAAIDSFAPPPQAASAAAASPPLEPTATLEVLTIPNPPARGNNRVRVTLKDRGGHAIDGAQVSVTFYMAAMPAMGMAAMRETAALTSQGGGVYTGAFRLESGGTWQVTAVAAKGGHPLAARQFNLSATGGM